MQNRRVEMLVWVGVTVMSAAALAFWGAALVSGGAQAVLAALSPSLVALFVVAHLPTMAGAILLWRHRGADLQGPRKWALGGAMVYFSAACIIAFFGNFMAAQVLGMLG